MAETIRHPSDDDKQARRGPHGCGGCDNRWGGLRTAHCGACHQTFTTPANFDRHRAGSKEPRRDPGYCYAAGASGLVLNDRGIWAMPGRDEDSE